MRLPNNKCKQAIVKVEKKKYCLPSCYVSKKVNEYILVSFTFLNMGIFSKIRSEI